MKNFTEIINEANQKYKDDIYVIVHSIAGEESDHRTVKLSQINDKKFLCKTLFNTPWEEREDWMDEDTKEIIEEVKKRGDKEAIIYEGDAGYLVIFKANLAKDF